MSRGNSVALVPPKRVPVLWMDDERNAVEHFSDLIDAERRYFQVDLEFATTIDEAREKLRSKQFAAFVADCKMDAYDLAENGAEFLDEVSHDYRGLPLFVYSGYSDDPRYDGLLQGCPVVAIEGKTEDLDPPLARHSFFQKLNYHAGRFYQVKDQFPEKIVFGDYLANPLVYASQVNSHWQKHGVWIQSEMTKRGYSWIVVAGSEVVGGSGELQGYPDNDTLVRLGETYNLIPFAYGLTTPPEESSEGPGFSEWNPLEGPADWYPTLAVHLEGHRLQDDFDTGAMNTHVSDEIVRKGILNFCRPSGHGHLGQEYQFFIKKVAVGIVDSEGILVTKQVPVTVVEDWAGSAFRRVNPMRKSLLGRDLLMAFELAVVLDSQRRTTTVRHVGAREGD